MFIGSMKYIKIIIKGLFSLMLATAAITQRSGSFLIFILILKAPIPQNGQKHSNNSSATCR